MIKLSAVMAVAGVAVSAMAVSSPVAAQPVPVSEDWQFRASIYGWFPDIGGKTTFPADSGTSINIDADKIISNLKFTFMGTLEAQKGLWGVFTDLVYLDVGGSKSGTRDLNIDRGPLPGGVTADANLDLKGTIWTLAGSYRVVTDR